MRVPIQLVTKHMAVMDPLDYAAPTRVGALVLPAGTLKAAQFDRYLGALRACAETHLRESDGRTKSDFFGGPLAGRKLSYRFVTKPVSLEQHAFFDLEPWRRQMLVIGVMHYSELENENEDENKDEQFINALKTLKTQFGHSVLHCLFVFGAPDTFMPAKLSSPTKHSPKASVLPKHTFYITKSDANCLDHVLRAVSAELLHELQVHWLERQKNSFHGPVNVVKPINSINEVEHAKRQQEGRTRKHFGSLLLLTGCVPESVTEFAAAAGVLKSTEDSLWLGSALDSIALALVVQKHRRKQVNPIPQPAIACAWSIALKQIKPRSISVPGLSKHSRASSLNVDESVSVPEPESDVSSVHSQRPQIVRKKSLHKSKPFTESTPLETVFEYLVLAGLEEIESCLQHELAVTTVYFDTVLRYISLLVCFRRAGLWTESALSSAIDGDELPSSEHEISIAEIQNWVALIYRARYDDLDPLKQVYFLSAISRLYIKAGLRRKWAFTFSRILSLLAASPNPVNHDFDLVEELLEVYGNWPALEAANLRTLVALGQKIRNPAMQTEAASRLLAIADKCKVSAKQQLALYHLIRSCGDITQCSFWDDDILLSASIKPTRVGSVKSKPVEPGQFLYNPFDQAVKTPDCVEAGVPTSCSVFVRNPLAVELELFELVLVDEEGNNVSDVVKEISIPPHCARFKVSLTVIPKDEGQLVLAGCYIQASGCQGIIYPLDPRIEVQIVPARPVLVLQELSLYKGWTMLLQGETKKFTLTLWNSSPNRASSTVKFSFHDSTIDAVKQASSRHDLSRAANYEYEHHLHKTQVCELVSELKPIAPLESQQYEFKLYGKRGVTNAAIYVDYGSEESLRRLKIPLQVTVGHSVVVENANILFTCTSQLLLILDLQNIWREQLEVSISTSEQTEVKLIDSSHTGRFVITLPWKPVELAELEQPIPSLRKQFTLDLKTPVEQLHMFWLKEKLLDQINGVWKTRDGRTGSVNLRMLHLTKRMASLLKAGEIEVKMDANVDVKVDEPIKTLVTVSNNSSKPVRGLLKLVPGTAASEFMLILGPPQQIVRIEPQSNTNCEFEVLFLAKGNYELASVLDLASPVFQSEQCVYKVS